MKKILTAFFLGAFISGAFLYKALPAMSSPVIYRNHIVTVDSGDTLWDIAKKCRSESEDIRDVVYRIRTVNDLHTPIIAEGQRLVIPVRLEADDIQMLCRQ